MSPSKIGQNCVGPINSNGDHIYSLLFTTIRDPFCHTAFLKPHTMCLNFLDI